MSEQDILIKNILQQIKNITEREIQNKEFFSQIKTEVDKLRLSIDNLLAQFFSKIGFLNGEIITKNEDYEKLVEEMKDVENQLQDLIREKYARETESGNTASQIAESYETIQIMNQQINKYNQQITALEFEKKSLESQIDALNKGLKEIKVELDRLDNSVINSNELTDILKKITEFTSYVEQIKVEDLSTEKPMYDQNNTGNGGVGGRRKKRHGRKHSTKKMKKGGKKYLMMRGGFIADYKPKTHRRRRNNKKRYSSSSRSKKTSPSISKTTSSY